MRRLNRQRPPDKRLHFRSKYRLARQALEALKPLLPKGWAIYVLVDRWYTSRRLINYVRRKRWHLIGTLKSNRKLDGVRVDQRERTLRHQRYKRIRLTAADDEQRTYLVRALKGKLKDVPQEVRVWVSRRHHRDKRTVYLMSTDLDLKAKLAFQWFGPRWWDEDDNFYLKELLGLGDFRVQSYEATQRWTLAVLLAWNYVLWRKAEAELAAWQKQQAEQKDIACPSPQHDYPPRRHHPATSGGTRHSLAEGSLSNGHRVGGGRAHAQASPPLIRAAIWRLEGCASLPTTVAV